MKFKKTTTKLSMAIPPYGSKGYGRRPKKDGPDSLGEKSGPGYSPAWVWVHG